jgi:uncharacterized protein involved in response to NO
MCPLPSTRSGICAPLARDARPPFVAGLTWRLLSRGKAVNVQAQRLFFPAAALYAMLAPWLLLASLTGATTLAFSGAAHARGLLFGYVGALIAGYLLGRPGLPTLALLFGLWLAGRLAELALPASPLTSILYASYGLLLASQLMPKFRAAKKWRNRVTGPLLALITCYSLLDQVLLHQGIAVGTSIRGIILPLALLMFFMGGRIITPTLAVAFAARGQRLPQRVQPVIEGLVIVLLLVASAAYISPLASYWAAMPAVAAGMLVLLRLYRWQLFTLVRLHADIFALGIGYLWLALGLLLFGCNPGTSPWALASLHVMTIGALGTLSSTVMLKLSYKRAPAPGIAYLAICLLLALAVLSRFLADLCPLSRQLLLAASAVFWSLNYIAVSWCMVGRLRGAKAMPVAPN